VKTVLISTLKNLIFAGNVLQHHHPPLSNTSVSGADFPHVGLFTGTVFM
jgi:hypothetical protein